MSDIFFDPMHCSLVASGKEPASSAGDLRDVGSVPWLGRSPGGGHGNPLQYSCQENPMDRGVWWATVHRFPRSQTCVKQLSTHALTVACQAPLSMGFPRQEYWNVLLFPPPGQCSPPRDRTYLSFTGRQILHH